jgi:Fe-S cluster biosynthesis and repair protein YggX
MAAPVKRHLLTSFADTRARLTRTPIQSTWLIRTGGKSRPSRSTAATARRRAGEPRRAGGTGGTSLPISTASPVSANEILAMARMVQCVKLGREAEGLEKQPIKGDLGKRVFDSVSKEAWKMWLEHSKMLINEYRLDLLSESGQRIWMTELEKYFFGEGAQLPPDFVAPKAK